MNIEYGSNYDVITWLNPQPFDGILCCTTDIIYRNMLQLNQCLCMVYYQSVKNSFISWGKHAMLSTQTWLLCNNLSFNSVQTTDKPHRNIYPTCHFLDKMQPEGDHRMTGQPRAKICSPTIKLFNNLKTTLTRKPWAFCFFLPNRSIWMSRQIT